MEGIKIMKYFKDTDGEIFGVDEGQEHIIKNDWVDITESKLAEIEEEALVEIASTPYELLAKIESSMTPRREREFKRGTDGGWWLEQEAEVLRLEKLLGRV